MPGDRRKATADLLFEPAPGGRVGEQATHHLERLVEIGNVEIDPEVAGHFRNRGAVAANADLSHRQRLADRQAPTLVKGRAYREQAAAVQQTQVGVAD